MATLSVTRNYADNTTLTESQLDDAFDSVETFVNTTKLNSDNLQSGGVAEDNIATGAVTATKLGASAVTTAKIADSAVTTVKVADSAITTAKLADSSVTAAKIADSDILTSKINNSAVTSAKIADSAVTAGKIQDGCITQVKMGSVGQQVSSSSGSYSGSATVATAVTNLSVSITTTGRPVFLGLLPASSVDPCYIAATGSGTNSTSARLSFVRGGTTLSLHNLLLSDLIGDENSASIQVPPGTMWHIDPVAAGTYTYTVEYYVSAASSTASVHNCKLIAYEI